MKISIPISVGELLDKISILQIKSEKVSDEDKIANIDHELQLLLSIVTESELEDSVCPKVLTDLRSKLKNVNENLWSIEDQLRIMETKGNFGSNFVTAARDVYKFNDLRAKIKRRINMLTDSEIVEEKYYTEQ